MRCEVISAHVWARYCRYSASVGEMFKTKGSDAFPILDNIALVDEALESKSTGTEAKQEL